MFCELVRFDDLTEKNLSDWSELIKAIGWYKSPFLKPGFTEVVSTVRDDVWVMLHGRGNDLEFIWPLQKTGRVVEPVGAPFSDYNGPIMHPEWRGDIGQLLTVCGLTCARITAVYDMQIRFHRYASEYDGTYICDLSEGAEHYFERQRLNYPRHAKKMRRLARKVEREVGPIVFNFDDRDPDIWQQLFDWKQKQYAESGRHNVLGPTWVKQMMLRLWEREDESCRGYLHTLKLEGQLIAAEYNLTCRQTIHGWIPAYDDRFSSYSPGCLLQDEIIREAPGRGFRNYDLGVSAGHYKKYYANYQLPVVRGSIRSGSALSRLNRTSEKMWRNIEYAHIPGLSNVVGQVRRRYDIIRSVETTFAGRARGVVGAAGLMLKKSSVSSESELDSAE